MFPGCAIGLHSDVSQNETTMRPAKVLFSSREVSALLSARPVWGRIQPVSPSVPTHAVRTYCQPIRILCALSPHPLQHRSDKYNTVLALDFHSAPCQWKLHLWMEFYQHRLKISTCTRSNVKT